MVEDSGAPSPTPAAPCGAGPMVAAGVQNGLRRASATERAAGGLSTLSAAFCPSFRLLSSHAEGGVRGWTAATIPAASRALARQKAPP